MENTNTMAMTSSTRSRARRLLLPCPAITFGTGCLSGLQRPIDATGLSPAVTTVDRARTEVAAKGHVALIAYVPGIHAWSPPIC